MIDDFSQHYAEVARLTLLGELAEARKILREVANTKAIVDVERLGISKRLQIAVFKRDRYICRYCSRRVVLAPVLRAFSVTFGADFPYHPHGKMTDCHIAFWRDIASCDHLVPVARGGTSNLDNLQTSCYMCNSIKQNWLIEELRWSSQPVPDTDWDGLSSVYPALIARMSTPVLGYFTEWQRALNLS